LADIDIDIYIYIDIDVVAALQVLRSGGVCRRRVPAHAIAWIEDRAMLRLECASETIELGL
jgi:hypothetical protein